MSIISSELLREWTIFSSLSLRAEIRTDDYVKYFTCSKNTYNKFVFYKNQPSILTQ